MNYDVQEMLELYRTGEWTHVQLGEKYGKDRTTIMHHIKKAGIPTVKREKKPVPVKIGKQKPVKSEPVVDKYAHVYDPPVNKGKRYQDYLEEALKRPTERHYHDLCREVPVSLDRARKSLLSGATLSI